MTKNKASALCRGMGRREFLANASALATLPSIVSVMGTPALAAEPKKGGRLRVASTGGGTTDSLNPATITDYMTFLGNWAIRNNLVEVDAAGDAIPELAESWDSTLDAATWTFKLRKGVEFHNGKSFGAADVIWSINQHRGEGSKSAASGIVAEIADIKADGSDTVVIKLHSGNAGFPYLLSDQHLSIGPEGTQEADWNVGIGTGGYILKDWKPGARLFAKRNENYWKSGRAHFDEIEILLIADSTARTSSLLAGESDVIVNPDLKTLDLLQSNTELQVIETAGNGHISIPMFTDVDPFKNNDVRTALKFAIDRQEFVSKILFGHGTLGNDQPINETYRYFASDLPQREYDPDKAKFHLKQAGLDTLRIDISAADTPFNGALDAALLFSEQAKRAGINLNIVREPSDAYWSNIWMKKPFCMSHWNGRSTEDWMFSIAYAEGANWNETHWSNKRFNSLLKEARVTLDDGKRRAIYREMQQITRDDSGAIIPAFDNYVMQASTKIKYGKIANNWNLDGFRLTERWWFA